MPDCESSQDESSEPQSTVPKHFPSKSSDQSSLNSRIKLTKTVDILTPPIGKVDVASNFLSNENEALKKFNHPIIAVKVRGEEFSLESQLFPFSPCTLMHSKWAEKMGLIAYPIPDVEFLRKNRPLDCNVCVPIKFHYENKFVFAPVFVDPDLSIDLLLGMDLLSYVEGINSIADFYKKKLSKEDENGENVKYELERPTRTQVDQFFGLCYGERFDPNKLALYREASHGDILRKRYEQQYIAVVGKLEELKKVISSPSKKR